MSVSEAPAEDVVAAPAGGLLARRKLVIVLAAGLSVLGLGGGLTAAVGFGGVLRMIGLDHAAAPETPGSPGKAVSDAGEAMLEFDEMIVNITGTSTSGEKVGRYMKIKFSMVYGKTPETEKLMTEKKPFLRDALQDYLRQLTEEELRGSIGMITLKQEMLKRARAVTGSDAPQEFLIGDLIIQ